METAALQPFGIEVRGVQLGSVEAAMAHDFGRMIAQHRVAVFRGQDIGDRELVRFLGLLGSLMFTEGETPVEGAPDLNVVSNVGRTTPPRSVFHTDTSYVERPPAFTALRVPGAGWADAAQRGGPDPVQRSSQGRYRVADFGVAATARAHSASLDDWTRRPSAGNTAPTPAAASFYGRDCDLPLDPRAMHCP